MNRTLSLRAWIALVLAVVLAAAGALVGVLVARPSTPGTTSAEAGFARDMQEHHAQAVEMSMIVRDRTTDSATRQIAYDIALTQQQQEGQMYAWLVDWNLPQARPEGRMAWMGHDMSGMDHDGAVMPGMATQTQLEQLQKASGKAAEVLFLQLMIAHHKGGVEMAQAVLDRTDRPEVVTLARSMVNSQQSEIATMEQMLRERGVDSDTPSAETASTGSGTGSDTAAVESSSPAASDSAHAGHSG